MTPMHVPRPGHRRARAAAVPVSPVAQFNPGHFTALIRAHDWPPSFQPQYQRTREVEQSEWSRINREIRVANGDPGTIVGLTKRADELIRQRLVTTQRAVR